VSNDRFETDRFKIHRLPAAFDRTNGEHGFAALFAFIDAP
jgi:hypothetical protein